MDRHHRTYKHQRNLLMLENVPRIHPSEVKDILKEQTSKSYSSTNSIGII